jgi:hypothetical protein
MSTIKLPPLPTELESVYVAVDGLSTYREARDCYYTMDQMRAYAEEAVRQALAAQPSESAERIEKTALNRYKAVPDGLFYKVVAGDGTRALYTGTKHSCRRIADKLTEAFLDGAFVVTAANTKGGQ